MGSYAFHVLQIRRAENYDMHNTTNCVRYIDTVFCFQTICCVMFCMYTIQSSRPEAKTNIQYAAPITNKSIKIWLLHIYHFAFIKNSKCHHLFALWYVCRLTIETRQLQIDRLYGMQLITLVFFFAIGLHENGV